MHFKTINFKLYNSDGKEINTGSLFTNKESSKITFANPIGLDCFVDLDKGNIQSPENFIGSVVRRLDKKNQYDAVSVMKKSRYGAKVAIIREANEPDTETLYFIEKCGEKLVFIEQDVKLKTHDGTISVPISSLSRMRSAEVLLDRVYCKNPVLNEIFCNAVLPYNYLEKGNVVKNIIEEIRRQKRKPKKSWAFFVNNGTVFTYTKTKYDIIIDSDTIATLEEKHNFKF